jgi:alkylation response protein AidB-like acyl-CoA dehydrogenase
MAGVEDYLRRVEDIADIVRSEAAEADQERRLGDKTVMALCDTGLLRMSLPTAYGGGELTVGQTFPVFEAMARVNGSAGWNLAIGATTCAAALGLADRNATDQILGDPTSIVAGTINFFNLRSRRAEGGYCFDGEATFMSGSSHADWFVIGGLLHEDGRPVFANDGTPRIIIGLTPASTLDIRDVWHVSGMRATASNNATVAGLFIPDPFIASGAFQTIAGDPSADFPLLTRAGAGLAFVALGAAGGGLDALRAMGSDKVPVGGQRPLRERADVQIDAARALGYIEAGRALVSRNWAAAEDKVRGGGRLDVEDQMVLRLSYVTATELATTAADLICRTAGSSGLFESDGIERAWRDTHAVDKHIAVSARNYERLGRIVLGLAPAPGPI